MGREFVELFNEWASTYDDTVTGHDIEYRKVFEHYDEILGRVASKVAGQVIEFGPGTGNLTGRLLERGCRVTAVEPSPSMRSKMIEKLGGQVQVLDGDFLAFETGTMTDAFVSSYAFHHLTDAEKEQAVKLYGSLLSKGGKIVFADTMYESNADYQRAVAEAERAGYYNLAQDLKSEYYSTIPFLKSILHACGFTASFERCNEFVWIVEAEKQN
ncbi:class I SAM-dependent methyltransferase [Peribacillus sp. SCS-37]|uniref:class I SAM-dependent methyltransferase n=1 Tax=Paraperibacillus esterisolvens TaxID=3115296 RepID=UPI003905F25B